jgi:hypothetical protein
LQHSCASTAGVVGDPGIRLAQVLGAFGDAATDQSVCANAYGGALNAMADLIAVPRANCIQSPLGNPVTGAAVPSPAPGQVLDPSAVSCSFTDVQHLGTPMQTTAGTLPPCNPAGQASGACWAIIGDTRCSATQARALVCRNGFSPTTLIAPGPSGPNGPPDDDTIVMECTAAN